MIIAKIIEKKLACLDPISLEIQDESSKHANHFLNNQKGEETHFKVTIISNHFIGKSLLDRHKIIYNLLSEELSTKIHALALKAITKDESENL